MQVGLLVEPCLPHACLWPGGLDSLGLDLLSGAPVVLQGLRDDKLLVISSLLTAHVLL